VGISPTGAIVFLGQDENGDNGIFVQDFIPSKDTARTRWRFLGRAATGHQLPVVASTLERAIGHVVPRVFQPLLPGRSAAEVGRES
jgi:hypothetical protein